MVEVKRKYDLWILLVYSALILKGFFTNFSIISSQPSLSPLKKLVFIIFLSVFIILFLMFFGSSNLVKFLFYSAYPLLFIVLILLLSFGERVNGAKRFVYVGGMSIQPAILMKVILIYYAARYLANKNQKNYDLLHSYRYKSMKFWEKYWFDIKYFFKEYWVLLVLLGIPYVMILNQPHLSIIILSVLTIAWMMWFANVKGRTLLTFALLGIILLSSILIFGKKYRGKRIRIYKKYSILKRLVDDTDKPISFGKEKIFGESQVRESLAALASGRTFGTKGMSKENFLYEPETDYIFSVIGEEGGFVWGILLFMAYSFIMYRIAHHAIKQKNTFKRLLLLGFGMNIFLNMLINTGVAMSILPSTGVTLPFISSGGSSIIANSISLGMVLNLSRRKERELIDESGD